MTFFLTEASAAPPGPPAKAPPSGPFARFGAGFEQEQLRLDAWQRSDRYAGEIYRDLADRLGDASPLLDPTRRGRRGVTHPKTQRAILDAARARAEIEPEAWGDAPLTREAVEGRVTKRLQAEYQDAGDVLASAPPDAFAVETLGMLAGGMADEATVATLPFGIASGGPLWRQMAVEFVLGAAGEALTLGRQRDMADRLNLPPPDAVTQLALAGFGSAALTGALGAAARGWDYARNRRRAGADAVDAPQDPADRWAEVATAEQALAQDRPPPPPMTVENDAEIGSVVSRIIGVESGGSATTRNPNSTAEGLGQFIDSTWLGLIERHRPDLMQSRSREQLIALKSDPRQARLQRDMVTALTRENLDHLRREGINPGRGELYLAHFLGAEGATKAILSDPGAPVSQIMSRAAIDANKPRLRDGKWTGGLTWAGRPLQHMSVGDLRRWADAKMGRGTDPGSGYAPATGAGYTSAGEIVSPRGTRVEVRYEVVDAADLEFAQGGLQNRQRNRPAPTAEVSRRAAKLDPALLMPSPIGSSGAPIVGPDGIIESGNGRVMSILEARERFPDRWQAYQDAIRAAGYDIEGAQAPILVARRTSELDDAGRRSWITENNEDVVERLSPTEQALTDRDRLTPDLLGLYDPAQGAPTAAGNRGFLRGALDAIGGGRVGSLVDADGQLTADGARRVRAALFARAYGDPQLTAELAEREGGRLRGAFAALADVAARWARMRDAAAAGRIAPEFDITADVVGALQLLGAARRIAVQEGLSVRQALDDALAQGDLLAAGPSPVMRRVLDDVLYRDGRARASDDVARILDGYLAEAEAIGDGGLGLEAPGPLEILDGAVDRVNGAPRARPSGDVLDEVDELGQPAPVLDGFNGEDWSEGATGAAAEAADARAMEDLRNVIEGEPFGPVRADLNGQPDEAIDALMEAKTGEVPVAMERPDIGPIAFVYGNSAFGLRHIVDRHGEDILQDLPRIVREGRIVETQRRGTRIVLEDGSDPPRRAVIRTDWDDQAKRWVVTAFEFDRGVRQEAEPGVPPVDAPPSPDATGRLEGSDAPAADQDEVRRALEAARRDALADGDFAVEFNAQQEPVRTASEVLDDLDADQEFLEILELCRPGGPDA